MFIRLFLFIREIQENDRTEEAFRYHQSLREVYQSMNISSLSFIHLFTQLPLSDLDSSLSNHLTHLQTTNQPILVFVGIHGNRGYSMDIIPVIIGREDWCIDYSKRRNKSCNDSCSNLDRKYNS